MDLMLSESDLGAETALVCGKSLSSSRDDVEHHARSKGVSKIYALDMPKHFNLISAVKDIGRLKQLLHNFNPDIIHAHMANAHLMAAMARGSSGPPAIVRSCYRPGGLRNDLRSSLLYRYRTDGIVVINQQSRDKAVTRQGFSADAVKIAAPGIDLKRFSPQRKILESRQAFGLRDDFFVIGMVTRIRESRRLDIVLAALKAIAHRYPQLHLLVVGRGSRGVVEAVIEKPADDMGIRDRIILAGYCRADRLVAAYRAMDMLVYPVPGTDRTCRTVREAMAAGVPVIASNTGFLPELIVDPENGRLMDLSIEGLAEIISEIIEDQSKLHQMRQAALETSQQRFSPILRAERVMSLYNELLNK